MSERQNFGKIKEGAEPPNLIELQTDSYKEFLQEGIVVSKRKEVGYRLSLKKFSQSRATTKR
jgi:DNA-directed RNA polymerase subunit beta